MRFFRGNAQLGRCQLRCRHFEKVTSYSFGGEDRPCRILPPRPDLGNLYTAIRTRTNITIARCYTDFPIQSSPLLDPSMTGIDIAPALLLGGCFLVMYQPGGMLSTFAPMRYTAMGSQKSWEALYGERYMTTVYHSQGMKVASSSLPVVESTMLSRM